MALNTRLVLAIHNHQPVGNFDHVFEQAYQDSYRLFLDVLEEFPDIPISLHISGSLAEWLDEHHPEYLDRVSRLVSSGQIELLGGAFYEPILAMLSSTDRVGQITAYSQWLADRLQARVRGAWIPERVWEQSMARDISTAGIEYTLLDDFHFRNAGLTDDQLCGYFVTEDEGKLLFVFPDNERLRYLIPFREPRETIDYLRGAAEQHPGAVFVFGDDGEKFGVWPGTKKLVYEEGWLRQFLAAVLENRDWLTTCTLGQAVDNTPPAGKVYLPDASYREMTEWVLPTERLQAYENVRREMNEDPRWPRLSMFIRGGYWRNYKVKYPEANEMYCRMMMISRRLQECLAEGGDVSKLEEAKRELYRGQCNCAYWHGAFGGIYLPHLRNAVYKHLIAADSALEAVSGRTEPWVEGTAGDYDFDARQEIRLASDKFVALIAPAQGGQLYELDIRSIQHNLLATLARRPEAYHDKVLRGSANQNGKMSTMHGEHVQFKQAGLNERLQYDRRPRKSLVDHFYGFETTTDQLARNEATDQGDFAAGVYEARIRRSDNRVQVQMSREGIACGSPLKITKGLTLDSGSNVLEIAYLLENLPSDRELPFAVEFNFAGLPAGADDRYCYRGDRERLGQLGMQDQLTRTSDVGLVDEWLGIDVNLGISREADVFLFPIQTVSQSEGGYELVHQSVVAIPRWRVQADQHGRWSVTMRLTLDTSLAESRAEKVASIATT